MKRPSSFLRGAVFGLLVAVALPTFAQQSQIGTVSLEDATVTGAASTTNDRATLVGNGTVVAKDHVAYVELARGGSVAGLRDQRPAPHGWRAGCGSGWRFGWDSPGGGGCNRTTDAFARSRRTRGANEMRPRATC